MREPAICPSCKAFSVQRFEIGAALWQKSGTGILPVIKGHHRQDADATIHITPVTPQPHPPHAGSGTPD
jgi:hypothetical protein